MINENQNDFTNLTLQQKKFIMMGGDIKTQQKQLSPETIKQINKNYRLMYFAFTSINWGQGKTLGMAWQKALEQMDAYVASKTKIANHPINNELVKIHNKFRRDMSKHIMTSDYSESKLREEHKNLFVQIGEKDLKKGKTFLDNKYQEYMPKQQVKETPIMKSFGIAQARTQQMLQQMLQMQME